MTYILMLLNDRMNDPSLILGSQLDQSYFGENRLMDGESSNRTVNYGTSISAFSLPSQWKHAG